MKKSYLSFVISISVFLSCQKEQSLPAANQSQQSENKSALAITQQTVPITAVSFPKEVLPVDGGRIVFLAKLKGYDGSITVGGYDPYFFQLYDGTTTFQIGFNANDGVANSGLVGVAGYTFACGDGSYSYENIYGNGNVDKWHYYVFAWDKDGIPELNDVNKKVAVYVDGVLKTISWHAVNAQTFNPLTAGVFNLITTGGPANAVPGQVIMDEIRIYDKNKKLVLWNTLGSEYEVTHSKVGLNGSFNGGGNACFVPGKSGNALIAQPVGGLGSL